MDYSYDLHIHSCLSPCGSEDMTPNNIVNMAYVKGLDIISVTDHNACNHARIIEALATKLGILAIPGMEVQTREEVHILCYFSSIEKLELFDETLQPLKSTIPNNKKAFGSQCILDINDNQVGEVPNALIMSINISVEDLISLVERFDGVVVPAHVNKSANSILANLGFIPTILPIKTIEVHKGSPINERFIGGYTRIYNSDAHYLENIQEPINYLDLSSKTIMAVLNFLSGKDYI